MNVHAELKELETVDRDIYIEAKRSLTAALDIPSLGFTGSTERPAEAETTYLRAGTELVKRHWFPEHNAVELSR